MNCAEIIEYLSAFVDSELEAAKRTEFGAHFALCSSCRNEFELERMMKGIVRSRLTSQKAPAHLRRRILQQLEADAVKVEGESRGIRTFLDPIISSLARPAMGTILRIRPALAIGAIAVVALVTLIFLGRRQPPELEAQPSDLVETVVAHYSSYLNGAMKLELVSSDRDELRKYFKDKVAFEVYIPKMGEAKLLGGVLCEHAGAKFLNFVYTVGGRVVLFSLACEKEIEAKEKISLSEKVRSDLSQSGWHFDTTPARWNVAVWKEKNDVCSVVSDMNREDLLALLKEEQIVE